METLNEKIANALKLLRSQKNMTQREFSDSIGMSQTKYNHLENGVASFHADELVRLMSVHKIKIESFMDGRIEFHTTNQTSKQRTQNEINDTLSAAVSLIETAKKQINGSESTVSILDQIRFIVRDEMKQSENFK